MRVNRHWKMGPQLSPTTTSNNKQPVLIDRESYQKRYRIRFYTKNVVRIVPRLSFPPPADTTLPVPSTLPVRRATPTTGSLHYIKLYRCHHATLSRRHHDIVPPRRKHHTILSCRRAHTIPSRRHDIPLRPRHTTMLSHRPRHDPHHFMLSRRRHDIPPRLRLIPCTASGSV